MLTLWASLTADRKTHRPVHQAMQAAQEFLSHAFAHSALEGLDAKVSYLPVVMSPEFAHGMGRGTRPRVDGKRRVVELGPELKAETFLVGSLEERLREYIGGIAAAAPHLAKLGATPEQIEIFRRVVTEAPAKILAAWPADRPTEPVPNAQELIQERTSDAIASMVNQMFGQGTAEADAAALQGLPPEIRSLLSSPEAMIASLPPKMREMLAKKGAPGPLAGRSPLPADQGGADGDRIDDGAESSGTPPAKIAIDPDGRIAEFLGRTEDGRQFFLTMPFEPATGVGALDGREFVALYLFDADGALLEARIDDFGPRATMDMERRRAVQDERLRSLGKVSIERIEVAPFAVDRFGTTFGLVPRVPDFEAVEMMPGNFMCFFPPWDSGEYDT